MNPILLKDCLYTDNWQVLPGGIGAKLTVYAVFIGYETEAMVSDNYQGRIFVVGFPFIHAFDQSLMLPMSRAEELSLTQRAIVEAYTKLSAMLKQNLITVEGKDVKLSQIAPKVELPEELKAKLHKINSYLL